MPQKSKGSYEKSLLLSLSIRTRRISAVKSVLACISKVIFLMVAGNIVKRYSELPKTITLTLNHILQLGFCRSLKWILQVHRIENFLEKFTGELSRFFDFDCFENAFFLNLNPRY